MANEPRFEFGENWQRFLAHVDEERIEDATVALRKAIGCSELEGKTFLDVGCGSGLSSLAARRLGLSVRAFDFDRQSVACARELKRRYRPDDEDWIIEAGSVLDRDYLSSLGRFDFVYAWGVLHHTGALWQALEHASQLVAPRGRLWLAVYNDQGIRSVWWGYVKRLYQRLPGALRPILVFGGGVAMYGSALVPALVDGVLFLCALRNPFLPLIAWYRRSFCATLPRGMHLWTDLVDWVGGYPFEFARPEQVFSFFRDRGFVLQHLVTAGGGHGCNEFVFVKVDCASGPEVVGE